MAPPGFIEFWRGLLDLTMMKTIVLSLVAAAGALSLGGCADGYGGRHFGGPGYDAYYDDFYGPYAGGYWGPDDVFMFSRDHGGHYERDEAHHFRHGGGSGFHGVHTARGSGESHGAGRPG
jgi:hypothetical protein